MEGAVGLDERAPSAQAAEIMAKLISNRRTSAPIVKESVEREVQGEPRQTNRSGINLTVTSRSSI